MVSVIARIKSSERHVRSESLKLWNIFKPAKNIAIFFFDSQLTGLIQNKTKYCNIKAFYKTHGIYSYNQWNYFQLGCMDKWRSCDISNKPGAYL